MLPLTPSQAVGPFFLVLVRVEGRASLVTGATAGQRIVLSGSVQDGAGALVPDALIEIWQANASGILNHPEDPRRQGPDRDFDGYGRVHTDIEGAFAFDTIKPGSVPSPDGPAQAPHLVVGVYARGLLTRLVTRIYFEDEPSNAQDPILACAPVDRRATLIARCDGEGRYRHDIVLQGESETVFFDV